jgi:hypothetical protein
MPAQVYKMDKTRLAVAAPSDESDERHFWHSATPHERHQALEYLREAMYGYDSTSARLRRLLEVTQLGKS